MLGSAEASLTYPEPSGKPSVHEIRAAPLRRNVTTQIFGAYAGDVLLPFVHDSAGPQEHVVDSAGPLGRVVQSKVHRITISSERDAVFDLEGHLGAKVVHQVLADAGKMVNRRYPKLPQVVGGADPRKHQQVG